MANIKDLKANARIELKKNNVVLHEQDFDPASVTFAEFSGDIVILATNMVAATSHNLGGVATGKFLIMESTTPIFVGFDTTAKVFGPLKFLLTECTFSTVFLQNQNTTDTADVTILVTG